MTSKDEAYRELVDITARHSPAGRLTRTAVDRLSVQKLTTLSLPSHFSPKPCLTIILQGSKELLFNGETFHCSAGNYVILAVDLPIMQKITQASPRAPHLGLSIALDHRRLSCIIENVGRPVGRQDPRFLRGISLGEVDCLLLDPVLRLMRLLDRPEDAAMLAPLIEDEILYRLLTGPDGARLDYIAKKGGAGTRIAKVIEWLRGNLDRQLSVGEIAERFGMSASSLHHTFKVTTGMTPMQFHKELRLHEARRLLLSDQIDVGTASFRVGYGSASQFSRDYKRFFTHSPRSDRGWVQ